MPWAAGAGLELEVEPPPAVAALLRTLGVACNSKVLYVVRSAFTDLPPSILRDERSQYLLDHELL